MSTKPTPRVFTTPESQREHYDRTSSPLQKFLAGVAITGALAFMLTKNPDAPPVTPKPQTSPYTERQLKELPQEQFTIETGEGADNAIDKVDPKVETTNGPLTQELRTYISDQAIDGSPYLQAGQQVEVPVIPVSALRK